MRVRQEPGNRTAFRPAFLTIPPRSCGQLHPRPLLRLPLACDVLSLLQIGILVTLQAPPFLKGHLSGGCTHRRLGQLKTETGKANSTLEVPLLIRLENESSY